MLKLKSNKFIVGVTGGISCGKSTVAKMLLTRNSLLIDADALGHTLLVPGERIYKKIIKVFGGQILKPNGTIDRAQLGKITFASKVNLNKLNAIMHPELIRQIKYQIAASHKKNIILDAALIIEAGLIKLVNKLVVVTATKKQQFLRSQKRLGLTKSLVAAIMQFQISQKAKMRFADFIIDNSQAVAKTQKQVTKIRRQLWKS